MTSTIQLILNRASRGMGALLMCLVCHAVPAQTFTTDADIQALVVNSRIVTHAHDDATDEEIPNVRVFSYEFQTDALDPYFLNDPGFESAVASGLPQGSQLNFNLLSSLRYWNGTSAVGFGNTIAEDQIRINRGAANVIATSTSAAQNGFAIANVGAGGAMHAHLNTFMESPNAPLPTDGVYLLAIDLGSTSAEIARSLPTYIVFNNGAQASALDTALEYVLHPLPGDTNFDGSVDTADFNLIAGSFGQSNKNYLQGDLNENGTVDSTDFSIFAGGYGQRTTPLSVGTSVPEPAGITGIAFLGWTLRRMRKLMH